MMALMELLLQHRAIRPIDAQLAEFVARKSAFFALDGGESGGGEVQVGKSLAIFEDPSSSLASTVASTSTEILANGSLVLLAAWLSRELGQGHVCLDLAILPDPENYFLRDLAKSAQERLKRALAEAKLSLRHALPDADVLCASLSISPLVDDGKGGAAMFVLDGTRLYLHKNWSYEQVVAERVRFWSNTAPRALAPATVALAENLFADDAYSDSGPGTGSVPWQKVGAVLGAARDFTVISGGPGTGKTTTVVKLLALLIQERQAERGALTTATAPAIALAAPTGKAAARLTDAIKKRKADGNFDCPPEILQWIPEQAQTLHRLLNLGGRRPFGRDRPLSFEVLVVDEASMVDLRLMAQLFRALPANARLILLGDKDQLASVEAGAVLGELCGRVAEFDYSPVMTDFLRNYGQVAPSQALPTAPMRDNLVMLTISHRFHVNSGIGNLAKAVNSQDWASAKAVLSDGKLPDVQWRTLAALDERKNVRRGVPISQGQGAHEGMGAYGQESAFLRTLIVGPSPLVAAGGDIEQGTTAGYGDYVRAVEVYCRQPSEEAVVAVARAFDQFRLLAAVRHGSYSVSWLNGLARECLFPARLHGSGPWYVGRPVLVQENKYSLRLYNGDIGFTLPDFDAVAGNNAQRRVYFVDEDNQVRSVAPSRLHGVATAFAMTVHKSQGSEFDHVVLMLPEEHNPVLTKELVYTGITRAKESLLLLAEEAVLKKAIATRTERASGLGMRVWMGD